MEYYCPHCNATLDDQPGFDPSEGTWTCTECGQFLMDDDIYDGDSYDGVAWFCDECGALLNRQSGFSDIYSSWMCTKCYHTNYIDEDNIYSSEEEYQKSKENDECPDCGSDLESQFGSYPTGCHRCSCGTKLYFCDSCNTLLNSQSGFSEYSYSWTCDECGSYNSIDSSSAEDDDDDEADTDECPDCGSDLEYQFGYYPTGCHRCSCGTKLFFCDSCNTLLNVQSTFDEDSYSCTCKKCGCYNDLDVECEEDDDDDEDDSFSGNSYYDDDDEDDEEDDDYADDDEDEDYGSPYSSYARPVAPVPPVAPIRPTANTDDEFYERIRKERETQARREQEQREKSQKQRKLFFKRAKAAIFNKKRIVVETSTSDYIGKNYVEVQAALQDMGFTKIKAIPVYDIYVGSSISVGQVQQVVIGGQSLVCLGEQVRYSDPVTITYHKKKRIPFPYSNKQLRKKNYAQIYDVLKNLGYTDISFNVIKDLITGWIVKEGSIESVAVNGDLKYKKNTMFDYDVKIVIGYHTKKR